MISSLINDCPRYAKTPIRFHKKARMLMIQKLIEGWFGRLFIELRVIKGSLKLVIFITYKNLSIIN